MIPLSFAKYSNRYQIIQQVTQSLPKYQKQAVLDFIYKKAIVQYSKITTIPLKIRSQLQSLQGDDYLLSVKEKETHHSEQCVKCLLELKDGQSVEAVWMKFKQSQHASICLSSQVGCALKCDFCSTGKAGFKRQMTLDEIVDQVLFFKSLGNPVDTLSFMGMGEALQNPRVFEALDMLTHPSFFNMSPRRLTVSTVGILPGLMKMTKLFPQVNLAFSLHSPFTEQRNQLVPMNRTFPFEEVLKYLESHVAQTNRRIFLAYLILPGVNDSLEHAQKCVSIWKSLKKNELFRFNFIRYNVAEGVDQSYKRPSADKVETFIKYFKEQNVPYTLRQSFGTDINAACGQLFQVQQRKQSINSIK